MTNRFALLGLVALAIAVPVAARAQSQFPDSSHLAVMRWRSIGPSRGGRSLAVAGDPQDRLTFYMGTSGGGVWKTTDGGHSWKNLSDGTFHTGAVGAVAVAASAPNVIYVGMGEACIRGDVSHGDGVYKSIDGGKTWTHLGLDATRHIARIRIDPTNPDVVYVAALGDAFASNEERGVFRSRDGGRSWTKVLYKGPDAGAIDLVMDPHTPTTLYATLFEARRFPWGLRSGGPGSGIFKSTDGGDSWTDITANSGFPTGVKGRIGIALSPARAGRLWAIVDAGGGQKGVYRTDDAGATWQLVSTKADLLQRPFYYYHIFADPKDADAMYVLNIDMWKSTDAGKTYKEVTPPHGDNHDLWIDPSDNTRMIEANDGGGTVTFDGGRSWSSEFNQPTAQIYHVTTDARQPYWVYGAQQDEGGIAIPSRSDYGAITQVEWEEIGGGESGYIAVDPRNPNRIFAAEHHWLEQYDRRTHQLREISPWPSTNYGWGSRDIEDRFQWTYPVSLSPHDPMTLYAAGNKVFRSRDAGMSWQTISPELTRHDTSTLEQTPRPNEPQDTVRGKYWGPITRDNTGVEWYAVVFAFAESPVRRGVLWAGSDDGEISLSRDAGAHWTRVTPPDMPEFALVSIIDPSPFAAGAAYVAATRYKLGDNAPYLYKTSDYGAHWTKITGGIPPTEFTRVIRADPAARGVLYAGTETSVYASLDDGVSWSALRLNLPAVPVHDLVAKDADLVLATHGRGFWVLDHRRALTELAHSGRETPAVLIAPDTVVRWPQGDRPLGAEHSESAGENPPDGALFQFWLRDTPTGTTTLTVLDSAGGTIRRWSSASVGRDSLAVHAGANRFSWDLALPRATLLKGVTLQGGTMAATALPGRYTARLEVGGSTYTTPFVIAKDPRSTATRADLVAQYRFVNRVRDRLTETHVLAGRVRTALERVSRDSSAATRDTIARLTTLEQTLIQPRAHATQDLSNYPTRLDSKLGMLGTFAARADARPTKQAQTLLAGFEAQLAALRKQVNALAQAAATPSSIVP